MTIFNFSEEFLKPEEFESLQKLKQRDLKKMLSSDMKLFLDLKESESANREEIFDKEKPLLSAVIDTVKENVRMRNLEESRKNNLEMQRENSKMCVLM